MASPNKELEWAFKRLAQSQNNRLDTLRFNATMSGLNNDAIPPLQINYLCQGMGMQAAKWLKTPDAALTPFLACTTNLGWLLIVEQTPQGNWVGRSQNADHIVDPQQLDDACVVINTGTRAVGFGLQALFGAKKEDDTFISNVYASLRLYRRDIIEACVASVFIGMLTLVTSLFSMQVYDRVIPTRSGYTLIILSSGVLLAILRWERRRYCISDIDRGCY